MTVNQFINLEFSGQRRDLCCILEMFSVFWRRNIQDIPDYLPEGHFTSKYKYDNVSKYDEIIFPFLILSGKRCQLLVVDAGLLSFTGHYG